ncbi:MAG TPA: hypothetical protein DEP23_10785 [Ruminococcaceae bacterium]|nr:hypothetical protein [Oscillospiraceae bacterium]
MKKKLSRVIAVVSAVLMLGTVATSCKKDKPDPSSSAVEEKYDFNGMKITFADTWGKDLTPGKDEATDRLIEKIDAVEKSDEW